MGKANSTAKKEELQAAQENFDTAVKGHCGKRFSAIPVPQKKPSHERKRIQMYPQMQKDIQCCLITSASSSWASKIDYNTAFS